MQAGQESVVMPSLNDKLGLCMADRLDFQKLSAGCGGWAGFFGSGRAWHDGGGAALQQHRWSLAEILSGLWGLVHLPSTALPFWFSFSLWQGG